MTTQGHWKDTWGTVTRVSDTAVSFTLKAIDPRNERHKVGDEINESIRYLKHYDAPLKPVRAAKRISKSTRVSEDNPARIGDEVVAFFEIEGVEIRRKGVVASIDSDGDLRSSGGGYISYDESEADTSKEMYITKKAPEPVKAKVGTSWEELKAAGVGSLATWDAGFRGPVNYLKVGESDWRRIGGGAAGSIACEDQYMAGPSTKITFLVDRRS